MTLAQAVAAVIATPTPWWLTVATGGGIAALLAWIGKRIIGAFDGLVEKVERFQLILATHERDDIQRFAEIDQRSAERKERLMEAFQKHADVVTVTLTEAQLEIAKSAGRIEALETKRKR